MEFIEFKGKTVDDAITEATIQFGVTSDDLIYEVIEKGSNGFLGINKKLAVIRGRYCSGILRKFIQGYGS